MAKDNSKIDPRIIDNPEYDEIPEDQRQALEIKLMEIEAEAKKKLISCYKKTRQGVIQKEKFVLPTLSSSTPTTDASVKVTAPVSATSSNVTMEQVENLFAEREVRLVDMLTDKLLTLVGKQPVIDDISPVSTVETTKVPVPQPSVTLLASQPPYGMLMHYFSGQTVTPTYTDPIVSIPGSTNFSRTNELVTHGSQIPPRNSMPPIGPISDEMFDRYV